MGAAKTEAQGKKASENQGRSEDSMANNPRSPRRDGGDSPSAARDEGPKEASEFKKPSLWISVIALLVVGAYTYFVISK